MKIASALSRNVACGLSFALAAVLFACGDDCSMVSPQELVEIRNSLRAASHENEKENEPESSSSLVIDYDALKDLWNQYTSSKNENVVSSSAITIPSSAVEYYLSSGIDLSQFSSSFELPLSSSSVVLPVSSSSIVIPSSSSYVPPVVSHGSMVDERDGIIYKTVTIGRQEWLAENLKYEYKVDSVDTSYPCHKDICDNYCKDGDCSVYGRYYAVGAALDLANLFRDYDPRVGTVRISLPDGSVYTKYPVRGVCPSGWHLPTLDEWNELYAAMDSSFVAMQAKGFEYWPEATDAFGFSAVPAGIGQGTKFVYVGGAASFWSTFEEWKNDPSGTPTNSYTYCWWMIGNQGAAMDSHSGFMEDNDHSIRCIKD